MDHRRFSIRTAALAIGAVAVTMPASAMASYRPATPAVTHLLTCGNKTVSKPKMFIISCADANSELTATSWSKWTATSAVGSTTFGLNLCNPYCAASKISLFPKSTVVLSAPEATKHGELFSKMVVTYTEKGAKKTFVQNWKGDPAYAK